jgi:DNA-binding MarR family transcriptional regulator
MSQAKQIRHIINRLARLDAAEGWSGDLNPAQRAAIEYLAYANRYSRSPSHVASYLNTTRGTMTQTLKALKNKGYIEERRFESDKRSISYELTEEGLEAAALSNIILKTLSSQSKGLLCQIEHDLHHILRESIEFGGQKPFGVCRACRYFEPKSSGGFCSLLLVQLSTEEAAQICHEQDPV